MNAPPLVWDRPGALWPHFPMELTSVDRDSMVCVPAHVQELERAHVDLEHNGSRIVTHAPAVSLDFLCAPRLHVQTNPGQKHER